MTYFKLDNVLCYRRSSAIAKPIFKRIASVITGSTLLLTGLCLSSQSAQAQVSLYPLVLQEQTERGQATAVINVANSSDSPFRARITAEPFTYEQAEGFQTLAPGTPGDLTDYLFFSPTELVVPPRSERRIRLIAQFPPSAMPGEYRAVIFTEPLQVRQAGDTAPQVNVVTRVAATLYVRNGDMQPDISVASAAWHSQQQHIRMVVDNIGDASVRPVAYWTLRQNNQVIATGASRPTAIMPGSKRDFVLEDILALEDPESIALRSGTYELSGEFVWNDGSVDHTRAFAVELQASVGE